jgi:hypothetical protein
MDQSARVHSAVRTFYAQHRGWRGLLVASLILTYVGGAVMFWYHAIYLGEGGPAISPWHHWLLDSTAGFVGLTPAIALILPFAHRAATTAPDGTPGTTIHPARFAVVGGTLLAFVTAPAPLVHDEFIGRGTWLAGQVTDLFGHHHVATGSEHEVPKILEMAQQVFAGIPTYVALMWITLLALRAMALSPASAGPPLPPVPPMPPGPPRPPPGEGH